MTEEDPARRRVRWWRVVAAALAALLLVAAAAFLGWALTPHRAEPGPLRQAREDPGVLVERRGDAVVVALAGGDSDTGVVFYPGARVEAEAYVAAWAPVAAATGVTVVLPDMLLNLAVFDVDRADSAVSAAPDVSTWYVGGHSLGGAMAAAYAGGEPETEVAGLVLWASYATESAGLADRDDLRVLSVSGSRDGLSGPEEVDAHRPDLPAAAEAVRIDGMNHAQFGAYGDQSGDGEALLSDAEARTELVEATAAFLEKAQDPPPARPFPP